MDNFTRALQWRLEKKAAPTPSPNIINPKELARASLVVGLPAMAGYGAGRLYSKVTAPKTEELDQIQAQYVTAKMQQAIEELEKKKKMQALKESLNGNTSTLRI